MIAKLEIVRVGGADHQRLIATLGQLKAALDEGLATRTRVEETGPPPSLEELADQIEQLRAKVREQLQREADIEKQRVADLEEEAAAARRRLEESTDPATVSGASQEEGLEDAGTATCTHCRELMPACATMRNARPDLWRALHHAHADEVERRRVEATAEMMARIGKPHPWL